MTSRTVAEQFDLTGGRPSGFDYMRIGLSVLVIAYHTIVICFGVDFDRSLWKDGEPFRPFFDTLIPSFFALSGFLVSGSLFRNTIPGFLTLRVLRIFPALVCEILISALIIGPALTAFTLHDYFTSKVFYTYLLNMFGNIHYHLPGVFESNYYNVVNDQLWTIPHELQCYTILATLAIFGMITRPRLLIVFFALFSIVSWLHVTFVTGYNPNQAGPTGGLTVLSFLGGVLVYLWRKKLPYSPVLAGVAFLVALGLLTNIETEYFAALPIAYVTVWLGLKNPKKLFFIAGADYSYGMYLYGFPIQQALWQVLPDYRKWYFNLALSLIVSAIAAYISWNYLEAKVFAQKKRATSFVNPAVNRVTAAISAVMPQTVKTLWTGILNALGTAETSLAKIGTGGKTVVTPIVPARADEEA